MNALFALALTLALGTANAVPGHNIGLAAALRTAQLKCKVATSDDSLRWHVRLQGPSWHVWTGMAGACGSMSVEVDAQTGTAKGCIEVVCTNYRDRTPRRTN